MILRPPRSTRTDTLFPYTTPSDLGCYVRHEYLLFGRGRPYRRDRIEGNFGKVAERLAIGQPGEPRRLGNVGQDRPVAGAQLRMALGAQPRPRRIDVRLPFTVDQDMADRDRVISLRQRDRIAPSHIDAVT